jgi:hypothetical protein
MNREARTLLNKKVRPGDVIKTPGGISRGSVVQSVDDDGLVQFHGDPNHRYSVDEMVHVHGKDKRMMRGVYGVKE